MSPGTPGRVGAGESFASHVRGGPVRRNVPARHRHVAEVPVVARPLSASSSPFLEGLSIGLDDGRSGEAYLFASFVIGNQAAQASDRLAEVEILLGG